MTKQISIELHLVILCTFYSSFHPKNSEFKKNMLTFGLVIKSFIQKFLNSIEKN